MAGGLAVVGGIVSAIGAKAQAAASAKAEKIRERMMQLEAMRKRREIIREGVIARAQAVSNASAQGGAEGSALQGGIAQVSNQSNRNVLASKQDEVLGHKVFRANEDYAKAGSMIAIGGGISSLGSAFA